MMKTLEEVLEEYYQYHPDTVSIKYWSGCNYHINQGNNSVEPVGTAQSIHDCEGCEMVSFCQVKQMTPIWNWSEEKEDEINRLWKAMKKLS